MNSIESDVKFPVGNINMTDKPPKTMATNLLNPDLATSQKVHENVLADFGPNSEISKALKQLNSPTRELQDSLKQASEINKLFGANSDLMKTLAAATSPIQELIKQGGALQKLKDPFFNLQKNIAQPLAKPGQSQPVRSPFTAPEERISISTPKQLGTLLKASRVAKKLTQQQLADLAGVGRRFVIECEAGKPRLEFAKVLQVAAAAGIDIFAIKR